MDVTVYLPKELGERAKREDINMSRTLRDALQDELDRRDAMSNTLSDPKVHELMLEDENYSMFTGRITGTEVAYDDDRTAFLTTDGRVIVYDAGRFSYVVVDDPAEDLRGFSPGEYARAMKALGLRAVIDL